jgi:hypothetical protein
VLKNLKYLDYTLIDEQMRRAAQAKHGDAMGELENQQAAEKVDGGEKEVD